ncbi:unnamed protein product [Euphydryas editha]|uniref:Uncharacterized protein n=1 Tax=Euphydryas editha TaxID=104508 RepID=A0AAU9U692_EUPED|nr:unnamed protein product [Euphydryas editha]
MLKGDPPPLEQRHRRGGSQAFGHYSANCHRPQKCVRCAGEYNAGECTRWRDEPPTCANCVQGHIPQVFKREAHKREQTIAPPLPAAKPAPQQSTNQGKSHKITPPDYPPIQRGQPLKNKKKRSKKKKPPVQKEGRVPAASSTPRVDGEGRTGTTAVTVVST